MSFTTPVRVAFAAVAALALIAPAVPAAAAPVQHDEQIQYQRWSGYPDWRSGTGNGILAIPGVRTGVTMLVPQGRTDFTDPHTGITKAWDYSTWTSPVHAISFGATEVVASWNADAPAGTWIQIELHGTYTNGEQTPWYVMGRWAKGDEDIKRSTLDGQGDPWSTIWTDTFSIDDASAVPRHLRVTIKAVEEYDGHPSILRVSTRHSASPC